MIHLLRSGRSVRRSLFLANAAIITLTTMALGSYIALWGAGRLRADMEARLADRAAAARDSLDERLRKMDSVSVSVLYSKLVKDRFAAYSAVARSGPPAYYSGTMDEALVDTLFAIIGPTMPVRQINIYDLKGRGFGIGMDNRARSIDPSTEWFASAAGAEGSMVLSRPHTDPYLRRYSSMSESAGELFISHARVLFDRYGMPMGLVEVEQSCDELFRDLGGQADAGGGETETVVKDSGGAILYPYAAAEAPATHGRAASGPMLERYAKSDFSGWEVEVRADEGLLLKPMRGFVAASLVIALGMLSLALVLSLGAARRITRPLSQLHDEIDSLELESLAPGEARQAEPGEARAPGEIEELSAAFREMRTKLKGSVDAAIAAQRAEERARMLALQSQMNPHFIYNTIATIGALAEEGEGLAAAELCARLSDMLRYVSSQRGTEALGSEELEFASTYLACIRVRFGERLSSSIEPSGCFEETVVPRLLIQPIVENAVKYATTGEPPWTIRVLASADGERWTVRVEDTGPGFSREALASIDSRVGSQAADGEGLSLEGLGLANIAARLRLRHGRDARFEYGNLPGGGAYVIAGGPREAGDA